MDNNSRAIQALRVRIAQILLSEKLKEGKVKVPVHLALGHEWLAVDIANAMKPDDKLVLSHRNVVHHLARRSLANVYQDYLSGRFGSMNMIAPSCGIVYTSSILGNQFPVACGIALADKVAGRSSTTFVFTGDGALEEGTFYESLTFAAKHKLRVVFVVEDNGWSMSSPIESRRRELDLYDFSSSIGVDHFDQDYRDGFLLKDSFPTIKESPGPCEYWYPIVFNMTLNTYGSKNHHYHHGPIDIDIDPELPALCQAERIVWSRERGRAILEELRKEIGQ